MLSKYNIQLIPIEASFFHSALIEEPLHQALIYATRPTYLLHALLADKLAFIE